MEQENLIDFELSNPRNMAVAAENFEFIITRGWFKLILNGKNLTHPDNRPIINDEMILVFAVKFITAINQLFKEHNGDDIKIPYAEYWDYIIRYSEDMLHISLFDNLDNEYVFENEAINVIAFCKVLLSAVARLINELQCKIRLALILK